MSSQPSQTQAALSSVDSDVGRASDRVALACRALSAAASDLRVAHHRTKMVAVDEVADMVSVETERVCELAEELAKLATNLRNRTPLATAEQLAN